VSGESGGYLNRTPDLDGLGFWIANIDRGVTLLDVAKGFIDSAEFKSIFGVSPSNTEMVNRFYQNILGRTPDKGGLDFWIDVLDSKKATTAEVLSAFSESPENQATLVKVIGQYIEYIHH